MKAVRWIVAIVILAAAGSVLYLKYPKYDVPKDVKKNTASSVVAKLFGRGCAKFLFENICCKVGEIR